MALEYFKNLFQVGACDRTDECLDVVTPKGNSNYAAIFVIRI